MHVTGCEIGALVSKEEHSCSYVW